MNAPGRRAIGCVAFCRQRDDHICCKLPVGPSTTVSPGRAARSDRTPPMTARLVSVIRRWVRWAAGWRGRRGRDRSRWPRLRPDSRRRSRGRPDLARTADMAAIRRRRDGTYRKPNGDHAGRHAGDSRGPRARTAIQPGGQHRAHRVLDVCILGHRLGAGLVVRDEHHSASSPGPSPRTAAQARRAGSSGPR